MKLPSLTAIVLLVIALVSKGPFIVQTIVPDYCVQRIGCFADAGERDLEQWFSYVQTSPLSCRDKCITESYPYAGTQGSSHCFCGVDFGFHRHSPGSCVNTKWICNGYPEYRCGNSFVNDIFMTGKTRQILHLGCFNDDLTHVNSVGGENADPLKCAASCRRQGFIFSGLQNGINCRCGNTYGSAGRSSIPCDAACVPSGATNCGGTDVNSVYLTGKDDFWESVAVASPAYEHLDVHALLDDSESMCIAIEGGSMVDFTVKFSTTAYYQKMTPGVTILVTLENSTCETNGKPNVIVYIDKGYVTSGFLGKFKKCPLFETLPDGLLNTCVFKCMCTDASCKEIFVRFRKSQLEENAKVCEIRSCYSV